LAKCVILRSHKLDTQLVEGILASIWYKIVDEDTLFGIQKLQNLLLIELAFLVRIIMTVKRIVLYTSEAIAIETGVMVESVLIVVFFIVDCCSILRTAVDIDPTLTADVAEGMAAFAPACHQFSAKEGGRCD
jgi:hypothetical protein